MDWSCARGTKTGSKLYKASQPTILYKDNAATFYKNIRARYVYYYNLYFSINNNKNNIYEILYNYTKI